MVAEIVIGNSSDFTVYFGDGVQGAVDTYGVYIKPESIKGYFMTPAAIKSILSLDNISIIQLGAQNVIYRMKGIIIDTFAEFENFKKDTDTHFGNCVSQPMTCLRCLLQTAEVDAQNILNYLIK